MLILLVIMITAMYKTTYSPLDLVAVLLTLLVAYYFY